MSILSLHICGGFAELADALPCDATSRETSAVQDTTLAGPINSIRVKSVGSHALLQFAEEERHKPLADGSANESMDGLVAAPRGGAQHAAWE